MPIRGNSLISVEQLNSQDLETIFQIAKYFKKRFQKYGRFDDRVEAEGKGDGKGQKVVTMIFAEPSTRTRLSFEMACARLGVKCLGLEDLSSSSVVKGETLEDTFRNVVAMQPDALIVRYGQHAEVDRMVGEGLGCPVISGGVGSSEHPTQALLDAMTIEEHFGSVKDQRVLLVGDILHSRVANSNVLLLKKMGAEVGYCTPEEFSPQKSAWQQARRFNGLKEGFQWATTVMGLRMQKERHMADSNLSIDSYRDQFRISKEHLPHLDPKGLILHPGPVMVGVDFTPDVLEDPRCKVLEQVTNGVYLRAAVMSEVLQLKVTMA